MSKNLNFIANIFSKIFDENERYASKQSFIAGYELAQQHNIGIVLNALKDKKTLIDFERDIKEQLGLIEPPSMFDRHKK